MRLGAGEKAQLLRALTDLPEDPTLVPSTKQNQAAHITIDVTSVPGAPVPSSGCLTHMADTHTRIKVVIKTLKIKSKESIKKQKKN